MCIVGVVLVYVYVVLYGLVDDVGVGEVWV